MEEHSENSLSCGLKRKTGGRLGWGAVCETGCRQPRKGVSSSSPSFHRERKKHISLWACVSILACYYKEESPPLIVYKHLSVKVKWNWVILQGELSFSCISDLGSSSWTCRPPPRASHTTAVSSRSSLRDSARPPGTRGQVWGSQWNKTEKRVKPPCPGDASTKRGNDSSEVKPVGVRTQSRISWPQWWWPGAGSFFVACVRVEGPVPCHGGG